LNKSPDGRGSVGGSAVRVRSEEFAKKFGIPGEEPIFCGVGGLSDMTGKTGCGNGTTGAVGKAGLDESGVKENGKAGIGDSLAGCGGATSAIEVV
jgi:hypothetical protein